MLSKGGNGGKHKLASVVDYVAVKECFKIKKMKKKEDQLRVDKMIYGDGTYEVTIHLVGNNSGWWGRAEEEENRLPVK